MDRELTDLRVHGAPGETPWYVRTRPNMIRYTIKQGDCVESVAFEHGFFWETLWDHPDNAALKELRKIPNALLPGDVIAIPDKDIEVVTLATEDVHKFVLKGVPSRFRVQFLEDDEPIADAPYTFTHGAQSIEGRTDGDGWIDHPIPPNAQRVQIVLGEDEREYTFSLGHLDPADTVSGAKSRLRNLGYHVSTINKDDDEELAGALKSYQAANGLHETGALDAATIDHLRDKHG